MARVSTDIRITDADGNVQKVDVLAGYQTANVDEAADPAYYGFIDIDGNWYIQKNLSGAMTYARGTTNYATNWTNRASLSYDTFDVVF